MFSLSLLCLACYLPVDQRRSRKQQKSRVYAATPQLPDLSCVCNVFRQSTLSFETFFFKQNKRDTLTVHLQTRLHMMCRVFIGLCACWWVGGTVGSFLHNITEKHSVKPSVHHRSCAFCAHSRSRWSSVQT